MFNIQKTIVFIFVIVLLIYMIKMSLFTRRRWEFRTYTFGIMILGLSILSLGTFLDMMFNIIDFPNKYPIIKICLSMGSIIYIIGIIIWSNYTRKVIEKYEELSLTDPMTGTLNRKGIEKVFGKIIEEGKTFFVVVCDLNKTKIINDNYGHIYGDEYIKNTTEIVQGAISSGSYVARIGGDEFVILMEHEEPKKLNHRITQIKQKVSEIFPEEEIGISVGYSLFPNDGKTLNELVFLADRKMYEDKMKSY